MTDEPKKADGAKDAANEAKGLWAHYVENAKSPIQTIKGNFFNKAAWKDAPGKTGIKAGGTVIGLVIAADALRSQREGSDGRPESRSALGRLVEAVLGLGVAAGSALHGWR